MYICICKAITDKQLEEAQKAGKTFNEVCRQFGVGSECGTCLTDAWEVIQKAQKQAQQKKSK
ncbi:MAG: (2Fe-2S)-binding protein [Bdellovibrionota bacterium]|nr:(2Fe-2S)-binding protein [Bdellovibrionota bacterium]